MGIDEIILMAREAGIEQHRTMPDMTINLIHFAALVAEAKDKEIAELAEKYQRVACAYLELSEKVKETGVKTSKWGMK